MRIPNVPPAATEGAENPSSYSALRTSGRDIRVIVAAVATEDPEIAPNAPEAAIVARDSAPRRPVKTTRADENSAADSCAADSCDLVSISPMRMNIGMTARPYFDAMSKVVDPAKNWATDTFERTTLQMIPMREGQPDRQTGKEKPEQDTHGQNAYHRRGHDALNAVCG